MASSREAGALYVDVRANLNKLEADLGKAQAKFSNLAKKVGSQEIFGSRTAFQATEFFKSITAGSAVATAGIVAMGLALKTTLDRGQAFDELNSSFARLQGGSGAAVKALDSIRSATQGLLSDTEIFRSANLATELGLSAEQFNQLASAADILGDTVGKSTNEALEALVKGLGAGQEKALKMLGVTIDTKMAEEDFARSIGVTVSQLNEAGKLEAFRIAALEQIKQKTDSVTEGNLTAADAWTQAANAVGNFFDKIASILNNSEALASYISNFRRGILQLQDVLLGSDAVLKDSIAQRLAGSNLNKLGSKDEIQKAIEDAKRQQLELNKALESNAGKDMSLADSLLNEKKYLDAYIDAAEAQMNGIKPKIIENRKNFIDLTKAGEDAAKKMQQFEKQLSGQQLETNAKQIQNTFEQIFSNINKATTENFTEILNGNATDFNRALEELKKNVYDKTLEGFDEGLRDTPKARAAAAEAGEVAASEMRQKLGDAVADTAVKLGEEMKREIKASADFFTDAFYNAFTGASFDMEDMLKRFGSGVLGGIMGQIFPGAGQFGNLQGLGQEIGASITRAFGSQGGGSSSSTGSIINKLINTGVPNNSSSGSLFGSNFDFNSLSTTLFGGGRPAGVSGPLMENGQFSSGIFSTGEGGLFAGAGSAAGYVTAGLSAVQGLMNMDLKDSESIGKGIGGGVGAGLGAFFGGPVGAMIGQKVGEWVGKGIGDAFDRQTEGTRNKKLIFSNLEQTQLGKNLTFSGVRGNISLRGTDLTKYKPGESMLQGQATGAVQGLSGVLFGSMGGTVAATGANIFAQAVAQGKNYTEVLINIRSLMDKLGTSIEQLKENLKNTFLDGAVSLAEFKAQLSSINDVARGTVASVKDGFAIIADSTTTPRAKLAALSGIFGKLEEMGVKSATGLQAYLTRVFGPDAAKIFDEFRKNGIASVADITKATVEQIAQIFTILQNNANAFNKATTMQTDVAPEGTEKSNPIPKNKPKTSTGLSDNQINRLVNQSNSRLRKNARGGVFTGTTAFDAANNYAGILGESGPEAIMPLAKVGGKLGVMASGKNSGRTYNIHVDARGASTGVDGQILTAIQAIKDIAVDEALAAMDDYSRRSVS